MMVSFYGFYYQFFLSQAMPPLQFSWSFFHLEKIPLSTTVFSLLSLVETSSEISELIAPEVQHRMGPLNMQKSVYLPLWENYKLYGRKILHIESFSAIESEN